MIDPKCSLTKPPAKMLGLQSYCSSSENDSDSEDKTKDLHLKPIDPAESVSKTICVQAAPEVVPIVRILWQLRLFVNNNSYLTSFCFPFTGRQCCCPSHRSQYQGTDVQPQVRRTLCTRQRPGKPISHRTNASTKEYTFGIRRKGSHFRIQL